MPSATAKQILWLRCLGLAIPDDATLDEVSDRIDRAKELNIHAREPNDLQIAIAMKHDWPVQEGHKRGKVAGQLYRLLRALAYVYSVYRHDVGSRAWTHAGLKLSRRRALDAAYAILPLFDRFEEDIYPTDESPDLFFSIHSEGVTRKLYRATVDAIQSEP